MLLAERKAYARHTRAAEEVMRDKMIMAKEKVSEERESKKSITGGKKFKALWQLLKDNSHQGLNFS